MSKKDWQQSILGKCPGVENHLGSLQDNTDTVIKKSEPRREKEKEIRDFRADWACKALACLVLHSEDSGFHQLTARHYIQHVSRTWHGLQVGKGRMRSAECHGHCMGTRAW